MDTPTISADFNATVSFEGVNECGVITVVTPSPVTGGNTVTFKLTKLPPWGFDLFPLDTTSRDLRPNLTDTTIGGVTWAASTTYKWAYRARVNIA